MDAEERKKFRRSSKWKAFRAKCRLHTSKDFITHKPLERDWNLHHLDLNVSRYDHIDDMNRFIPLNLKTHEAVHLLYNVWKKDRRVIKRLLEVFERMEECTNGKESKASEDR